MHTGLPRNLETLGDGIGRAPPRTRKRGKRDRFYNKMGGVCKGTVQGELPSHADGCGVAVTVPVAGCFDDDVGPSRRPCSFQCLHCHLSYKCHWIQPPWYRVTPQSWWRLDYGPVLALRLSSIPLLPAETGMASALETLCGQAYGAERYQRVGTFTYGAIIWLSLACLPVCVLWIYTDKLLILIGQDPVISAEAGKFSIWLIPSLFPYAILQSLVRYLQTQSLIFPMVFSSLVSICIHLPVSWAFIFKLKLGSAGAALSIGFSYWLNAILLGLYVKYSSTCKKTRASFSKDVFLTMGEFFQFAIPSAVMVCLEWWTFEIVILLGGLLPNPEIETSVLSICLTITTMHYLVPYSFGAAASTRVSNELGAGKPQAAKVVVSAVLVLSIVEFVTASTVIFFCRDILGYSFSNEKGVVHYVKEMTPFLCVSIVMDSLQAVLSGVARGSGWQHMGAYVNLGAYYLVGIPLALLLGFVLHLKGEGLWSGLVAGATVQSILLGIITFRTDWEKLATEARRRMYDGKIPTHDELT